MVLMGIVKKVFFIAIIAAIIIYFLSLYENSPITTAYLSGVYCTDTDKGISYYAQGTVVSGGRTVADFCIDGTNDLTEFYCEKGVRVFSIIECESGCAAGACKRAGALDLQLPRTSQPADRGVIVNSEYVTVTPVGEEIPRLERLKISQIVTADDSTTTYWGEPSTDLSTNTVCYRADSVKWYCIPEKVFDFVSGYKCTNPSGVCV